MPPSAKFLKDLTVGDLDLNIFPMSHLGSPSCFLFIQDFVSNNCLILVHYLLLNGNTLHMIMILITVDYYLIAV